MRRPTLLAAFLLLAGCLDFDEQEIRVAYDAERDRIDAQLVYHGLYSASMGQHRWFKGSQQAEDVHGTDEQLGELLDGHPIFALFCDLEIYYLNELRASDDPRAAALAKLTTVDRGEFFRDGDGRLCGWQHLRIRDVTRALEICDEWWRARVADPKAASALRALLGCQDPESVKLWDEARATARRWFERRDAELLLHIPSSTTAARALALRFEQAPSLDSIYAAAARDGDDTADSDGAIIPSADAGKAVVRRQETPRRAEGDWLVAKLHAFGVTVRARDGGADLVLWEATRPTQRLAVKQPTANEQHYDLAPYLAQRKVEPRTDVTDATLAQAFAEFRAQR